MLNTHFAEYSCGNRYYYADGQSYPTECPHDDCDGTLEGTYEAH